jgi:hypothetical protein
MLTGGGISVGDFGANPYRSRRFIPLYGAVTLFWPCAGGASPAIATSRI